MKNSIFSYRDYKKYLLGRMSLRPKGGRGFKKAIAGAIRCQTAFVSHVFGDRAHFSLEQGEAIGRFLGLAEEEARFFIRLIEFNRAGTSRLKEMFRKELDQLEEQNLLIKKRVAVKATLSREDQAVYYSAWHYAAIHVALTLPELRTADALARYFSLSRMRVNETLRFLVSVGLAVEHAKGFAPGEAQIHLERNSPLISKHHANWRFQAIRACEADREDNLHFSSVFTLSHADAQRIRADLVQQIEESVRLVKESKEERICVLNLDFFEVSPAENG